MFSSSLDQRYTRNAEQNSDEDMLTRNLTLAGYATTFLVALVLGFLWSNGLL
jgi:CHASE1-domain containing sensor protein